MRITSIDIENFKAIDTLQFNPKMLNIFVGRNNTGKTSILQAIRLSFNKDYFPDLFFSRPSAALKYGENKAKLELKLAEDKRAMVELEIERSSMNEMGTPLENAVKKTFERALQRVRIMNRVAPKKDDNERRVNEIKKELAETLNTETILKMAEKGKLIESAKECVKLTVGNKSDFVPGPTVGAIASELALQIAGDLNIVDFLDWSDPRNIRDRYYSLDSLDYYLTSNYYRRRSTRKEARSPSPVLVDNPIEAIDEITDDKGRQEVIAHEIDQIIKNDKLVPGLTRFNFDKLVLEGVDYDVSMDSMGDGFKALIGILASLYQQQKNTIILLEEPEVHMHPGYLQELVKYLVTLSRTRNIQLFISTHSLDFISCFLDKSLLSPEDFKFVQSEFYMLLLSRSKDVITIEETDYNKAVEATETLEWDLRGI